MSLYHEAAGILDKVGKGQTSLKTEIFGKKDLKSNAKTLYALTSEAAKWSEVLAEVVEKSGILKFERQLIPTLALVLTHDLLLSKKGVALPIKHGLHGLIARHKARLSAELTRTRVRRGFASLDALRAHLEQAAVNGDNGAPAPKHPRWIRINTLKTTLAEQRESTFKDFEVVHSASVAAGARTPAIYLDEHVPNLVAVSHTIDLTKSPAYREGKLIFQDKASCFPAYLLNPNGEDGDVIDATAAPGNKTTHLAAILREQAGVKSSSRVFACEKDATRSLTLEKMTKLADPEGIIHVKAKQNFLKLDPNSKEFANVTALLLDPSCSGSGIVGRDEGGHVVHLPSATAQEPSATKGKKRKRAGAETKAAQPALAPEPKQEEEAVLEESPEEGNTKDLGTRLAALSEFQGRLLQHAMAFPAARRISYSTCSIHAEENEHVVMRALMSEVAQQYGWRILRRDEQVDGLRIWRKRGDEGHAAAVRALEWDEKAAMRLKPEVVVEGCVRCEKSTEDATMGFFVAGFVRDEDGSAGGASLDGGEESEDEDDEWGGFRD